MELQITVAREIVPEVKATDRSEPGSGTPEQEYSDVIPRCIPITF
jgi:hypothetical protein